MPGAEAHVPHDERAGFRRLHPAAGLRFPGARRLARLPLQRLQPRRDAQRRGRRLRGAGRRPPCPAHVAQPRLDLHGQLPGDCQRGLRPRQQQQPRALLAGYGECHRVSFALCQPFGPLDSLGGLALHQAAGPARSQRRPLGHPPQRALLLSGAGLPAPEPPRRPLSGIAPLPASPLPGVRQERFCPQFQRHFLFPPLGQRLLLPPPPPPGHQALRHVNSPQRHSGDRAGPTRIDVTCTLIALVVRESLSEAPTGAVFSGPRSSQGARSSPRTNPALGVGPPCRDRWRKPSRSPPDRVPWSHRAPCPGMGATHPRAQHLPGRHSAAGAFLFAFFLPIPPRTPVTDSSTDQSILLKQYCLALSCRDFKKNPSTPSPPHSPPSIAARQRFVFVLFLQKLFSTTVFFKEIF